MTINNIRCQKISYWAVLCIICFSIFSITPAKAQDAYSPDLLIKYYSSAVWGGAQVYSLTGNEEILYQTVNNYNPILYTAAVVNRGSTVDKIKLVGDGSSDRWNIKYFDEAANQDITAQVVSSGWISAPLTPSAAREIQIRITPISPLSYGAEKVFVIRCSSLNDPARSDAAKIYLTVQASNAPDIQSEEARGAQPGDVPGEESINVISNANKNGSQPDAIIKLSGDTVWVGKNIFETDDSQITQVKTVMVNPGDSTTFNFQIINSGDKINDFVVRGGALADKTWIIKYLDGGKDITKQIIEGQYSLKLKPDNSKNLSAIISLPENANNQDLQEFLLIISSIQGPGLIDIVKGRVICDIDADQDKIPDLWERKNKLNPRDPNDAMLDPDGDGLVNLGEYQQNTDPRKKDTDEDGLWDGAEIGQTEILLNGSIPGHKIITGPTVNALKEIIPDQAIHYVLVNPDDEETEFIYRSNEAGYVLFVLPPESLDKTGVYTLKTMGNGKIFEEDKFLVGPVGYVYSQKTKNRLANVKVDLMDCSNNKCSLVAASTITNSNGEYQPFMVKPGVYRLFVEEKDYKTFKSQDLYITNGKSLIYNVVLKSQTAILMVLIYIVFGLLIIGLLIWYFFSDKLKDLKKTLNREIKYQPDGQIKNPNDLDYLGDTIYNLDGEGQTKKQNIHAGEKISFNLRAQNDGSDPDQFIISGPAGNDPWEIRYYNVLEGGNDITNAVINEGWLTGTLSSGLDKEIRLEVTLTRLLDNEPYTLEIPITFTSLNNPEKKDIVKAMVTVR